MSTFYTTLFDTSSIGIKIDLILYDPCPSLKHPVPEYIVAQLPAASSSIVQDIRNIQR